MKVFLGKVVLIVINSLRGFYIGINSKQPRRDDVMNDSTEPQSLAQASIRIAVAAGVALLLGVGVFGIGDVLAEEKTINMFYPREDKKEVKLKLSVDTLFFVVKGCYCANKAQNIKKMVMALPPNKRAGFVSAFGPIKISPGETITKTYYCYSAEQIQILQGDNQ